MKEEKVKRLRARRWSFTLNNYTEDEIVSMSHHFRGLTFVIGKEVGAEGTPHLQGYVEFKNQRDLSKLKTINERCHWEKSMGNRESNFEYCTKEDKNAIKNTVKTFKENLEEKMLKRFPIFNREWQTFILDTIKEEPDDRTIYWMWEPIGNSGKTTFCKYLSIQHGANSIPPKSADAFHSVAKLLEAEREPKILLIDIPRSSIDYINYQALEKVKDGFFCSGKYEGLECIYPSPHVFVFANELPNIDKMSKDRWKIKRIKS